MSGTTYQIVPTQPVPWQTLNVSLGGQACTINLYQRGGALYMDLITNGAAVFYGVLCLNGVPLVQYGYQPFVGQLIFWAEFTAPLAATTDPTYSGLGTQFQLCYYP